MNVYGWTSWGWYDTGGPGIGHTEHLRRWKWYGRTDVYVETNDFAVLAALAGALERTGSTP